ncbi:MAG: DUF3375 family protein [Pirellula sp.]
MHRHEIIQFFESSPATRLLRSDLAAWVVCFLKSTFKDDVRISIGQSELRGQLAEFQRWVRSMHPNTMQGPPERYLSQWTESLWLKRSMEASSNEPQYQLTPAAEEAIRFVEESTERRKRSIGTEGRLRLILDTLQDIVRGASSDPQKRLHFLRSRVDELQQEIDSIESGTAVQAYQPAQIRERFQTAVHLLRELQSDFRAVEEQFHTIALRVQSLQAEDNGQRGSILKFALDAEDMLKSSDEGISFFAFVRFLLSPNEQMAARKNLQEIQNLEPLAEESESLARMNRMMPALLAEADQVMRTTSRLSTILRRVLDSRASAQRARAAKVLGDIRRSAVQMRNAPPSDFEFTIDCPHDFQSPMARPFWSPAPEFVSPEIIENVVDAEVAQQATTSLQRLQRLDFRKLRSHVREATLDGRECTLQDLLDCFPTRLGMADILGYIQIAHDDGHTIDSDSTQCVTYFRLQSESPVASDRSSPQSAPAEKVQITAPRILFRAKAKSRPDGGKPR